jgi:hypothetical protein
MTSVCENRAERYVINNHRINLPSLQRTLINRNYAKLWYAQAVNAASYAVSYLAIRFLRLPPESRPRTSGRGERGEPAR